MAMILSGLDIILNKIIQKSQNKYKRLVNLDV
jgi:hypothetical protein